MKNITLKALIVLAGVLSAAGAFAQEKIIESNVPFAFSVGNKVLPAGRYEIKHLDSVQIPGGVLIRNVDHPEYAAITFGSAGSWTAMPVYNAHNPQFVFDIHDGKYLLREVRGPVGTINIEFPRNNAEKNAARTVASTPKQTTNGGGL
ncbi:MAG TPA: hypothetical protein VK673_10125 [Chthoniobacterales bacterium]|nr:hypothetical protein [Chthoniobacterales bacterium]